MRFQVCVYVCTQASVACLMISSTNLSPPVSSTAATPHPLTPPQLPPRSPTPLLSARHLVQAPYSTSPCKRMQRHTWRRAVRATAYTRCARTLRSECSLRAHMGLYRVCRTRDMAHVRAQWLRGSGAFLTCLPSLAFSQKAYQKACPKGCGHLASPYMANPTHGTWQTPCYDS